MRRLLPVVVLVFTLVGCSRGFGEPASSGGSPTGLPASSASASPGVARDCGELAADACRKVLDAAVRLVPPGEELNSATIAPWHGEFPYDCDENPCPSFPAHWVMGAELRLADRSPLELNCTTWFVASRSEEEILEADDLTVFEDDTATSCHPVDKAERRFGTLDYRVVDESNERLFIGHRGADGSGSHGTAPECSRSGGVALPFSFYVSRVGDRGYDNGSRWREVFRSEDLGNRSGQFRLLITIHSFDDVSVEEIHDRDYFAYCEP